MVDERKMSKDMTLGWCSTRLAGVAMLAVLAVLVVVLRV